MFMVPNVLVASSTMVHCSSNMQHKNATGFLTLFVLWEISTDY